MTKVKAGIAVAVIALAFVLLASAPLSNPKVGNNETAAVATLRNLRTSQAYFQETAACDVDGDRLGEFGTFGELTGADGIRADAIGWRRKATFPSVHTTLSSALAATNGDGVVMKSGFAYRIFLPGPGETAVHEGKSSYAPRGEWPMKPKEPGEGPPLTGPVDVDPCESRWCAYAWPVAHGNSGNRVFFVDQSGDVWQMANKEGRYDGFAAGPEWNAAMPLAGSSGWNTPPRPAEYRGRDGNLWKPVN